MAVEPVDGRICVKCGKARAHEAFLKKNGKISSWCESCRKRAAARYRRRYYASLPPDRRHTLSARRRARNASVRSEEYSRNEILVRWGGRCAYCDAIAEHLDHVMPLSRGGEDIESNILPACAECNLSKGAKTLAEWASTF